MVSTRQKIRPHHTESKICLKIVFAGQKIPSTSKSIQKMEKINFHQPKYQFLRAEIRFLLERL